MEQFPVSRTVIREAIKVLANHRLVWPEPGWGTFVARRGSDLLIVSMDTILHIEQGILADLLELRRMIEGPTAGGAPVQADSEHIAAFKADFANWNRRLV